MPPLAFNAVRMSRLFGNIFRMLDVSYVFEGAASIKAHVSIFNEDCSRSISTSDGLQTIRTPPPSTI